MSLSRNTTLVQNHKVIRILNSLDAMRNSDNSRLPQLLSDNLLNLKRGLLIDRRSRFIQNDNSAPPQNSPRKSDKLALTLAKISPSALDVCIKMPAMPTTQTLEDLGTLLIRVFARRIQIEPDATREEHGILCDKGNAGAERLCIDIGYVDTVDENATGFWSDNA
jgi:hypothetical protein